MPHGELRIEVNVPDINASNLDGLDNVGRVARFRDRLSRLRRTIRQGGELVSVNVEGGEIRYYASPEHMANDFGVEPVSVIGWANGTMEGVSGIVWLSDWAETRSVDDTSPMHPLEWEYFQRGGDVTQFNGENWAQATENPQAPAPAPIANWERWARVVRTDPLRTQGRAVVVVQSRDNPRVEIFPTTVSASGYIRGSGGFHAGIHPIDVARQCNGSGYFPPDFLVAWADDWDRAGETAATDPNPTPEPSPEAPPAAPGQIPGVFVNRTRRMRGRVVAVRMPSEAVTDVRNLGRRYFANVTAAAGAFGLGTVSVRRRCSGEVLRNVAFDGGVYVLFWRSDWEARGATPTDRETPAPAPERAAPAVFPRPVIIDGREIGQISRCGQGYYAKVETQSGTVDFFNMRVRDVEHWANNLALNTQAEVMEDDHDTPQPETIRQPGGVRI